MPAAPTNAKQSRTHQSPVRLPPCRDLINQADTIMLGKAHQRGVMATGPPPPILPLVQRAPGQAPYTRSDQKKMLPSNVMMPPPPLPAAAHRHPMLMGHRPTHQLRQVTLHPTNGGTEPDLRVLVVSSEADYHAVMNQIDPSFMRGGAAPVQGRRLAPAPPAISQSSRKGNNNVGQATMKIVHEDGKGKARGKAQKSVRPR